MTLRNLGTSTSSLNAAFATTGEVRSKVKTDGTDQTATLNAELAALVAAGGGTLVLPVGIIRVDSAITIPNDAATPVPHHGPIRIVGRGGTRWATRSNEASIGGSVLDLKGTDTYGKVKDNAVGLLAFQGVTFTDSSGGSTPFLYTTNATLHIDQNAFIGSKSGVLCDQDAIVCGGVNQVEGGAGWTDGFQGYGTIITRNYFQSIRRAVYGRVYFNGNTIRDNTIWQQCGSNLTDGAAIDIDAHPGGSTGQSAAGNVVAGNLIEMAGGYKYAIRLRYALNTSVAFNNIYDTTASAVAGVLFDTGAQYNVFVEGFRPAAGFPAYEDRNTGKSNTMVTGQQSVPSEFPQGVYSGSVFKVHDPAATAFLASDDTGKLLFQIFGATRQWYVDGPMRIRGSSSGTTTAMLEIGDSTVDSAANLKINAPTGRTGNIQFQRAGTNTWLFYDGGSTTMIIRDTVNSVNALEFIPAAGVGSSARFQGAIRSGRAATASRPTTLTTSDEGARFWDSTLKKPIWWTGTSWVDATGAAV